MEAQTDLQTYLEQGKQALASGQGREAAIAYAHGAQMEADNPMVHLGLAEANLALGNNGVVQMACHRTQELQSAGGIESTTAQALLDVLDRRYERALQNIDSVISQEPGTAYAHALRAYLLRATGQDYDANLARARAGRLSYGGHFDGCFPSVEAGYAAGYGTGTTSNVHKEDTTGRPRAEHEAIPTWSRPNSMQRQMVRTRFMLSRYPTLLTYAIIGINVVIYLILVVLGKNFNLDENLLYASGAQFNVLVSGEYWRIFTAMFLHFGLIHVGLNMLSLFFIGRFVEIFFGKWRFIVIYLASGIIGGVVTAFLDPHVLAAGASGAIFGVFGALGVFLIVNRRALGGGQGMIGNWVFWLGLNLVWGFSVPNIGIVDHIGGLVAGMILAFLLIPKLGQWKV